MPPKLTAFLILAALALVVGLACSQTARPPSPERASSTGHVRVVWSEGDFALVEINGMPCVTYREAFNYGYASAGGLQCDWSRYGR